KFELTQIPREENKRADWLARIASSNDGKMGSSITTMHLEGSVLGKTMEVEEKDDWRNSIHELLQGRVPMGDKQEAERVARYLSKYFEVDGIMFKKSLVGPHLRCVSEGEGNHVLREIHEGCCGAHVGSRALAGKALRAGYYWPKMRAMAEQLVQKCEKCQRHGQITHIPAEYMTTINTLIPFAQWGIDLVGPLPMGTGQRKFLVVAVDYFTKWVEAEPLAKITEEKMIQFLFNNICCRFGVPKVLISDNGTQFQGKRIQAWCLDMGIKQRFASVAHPQANGQVE
ncbi:Unknown protein, partial [Striga hermonthica]